MSTSGQILGDTLSSEGSYLNWQLASQNIPGNYSVVNWQVGWRYPPLTCRGLRQGSAHMNGVLVYNNQTSGDGVHAFSSSHTTPAGDHTPTKQFAAGTVTIAHNSDGTKTFSADVSMRGWEGGGPNFLSDGSSSWALPAIPREPGTPTTPFVESIDQTEIRISWVLPIGASATSYTISYGTSSDATGATTTSGSTNKTLTGLTPGTKYYFKVKATNSVGDSPYSSISNATTIAGAYVLDGTYKKSIPYVRDGGTWKLARPYAKILGVWRISTN